jgi:hypothetical protein
MCRDATSFPEPAQTRELSQKLLTEMSIRDIKLIMFWGSKVWWVRKADNLTAIYEPIV